MQHFSTHAPQQKESVPTWSGNQPAKFTGGRFHQNHPRDELDSILTSNKPPEAESSGKKQFTRKNSCDSGSFKTHLKTFDIKYEKSKIFQIEELEKYKYLK
jgi:hypothetical protein